MPDMTDPAAPPPGRVVGLGGVFFRARDSAALARWYQTHLGVPLGGPMPQAEGLAVLAAFSQEDAYWPPARPFMLNLRVAGLDALSARLEAAGIAVERRAEWDTPQTGRFARIVDPEGVPIELWEPPS